MTALRGLALTYLCMYCSSCLKIDVVWVTCWYEPIFKNHQTVAQMEECLSFLPEWILNYYNHCPSLVPIRHYRSLHRIPPSLVCYITVGEEWGGKLGGAWRPSFARAEHRPPMAIACNHLPSVQSHDLLAGSLHFLSPVPFPQKYQATPSLI